MSRRAGLIFLLLCIFFLGSTIAWLRLDHSPPAWDDGYYLTSSLVLYDALVEGGLPGFAGRFMTVMRIKPPLIAALPAPFYLIAGRKTGVAYAVNLVALLVIFAVLYAMGTRYASPRAGLLAVYIVGTMPIFYGLSRWFLVECGLTALVCLAIWLAAEWSDFDGTLRAVMLGSICGLGLLMKTSFPLYVLVPLAFYLLRARLAAKIGVVAGAAALALPWYLVNYRGAFETLLKAGSSETAKVYSTGDVFSAAGIWAYLVNLSNAGPLLYFVALPVLGVVFWRAIPRSGRRGLVLCGLWGLPVLFLIFGHYRDLRYAAPLYPALALALAIVIDSALWRRGVTAAGIVCIVLALPLLSMLQASFHLFGEAKLELGGLLFVAPRLDYARMYRSDPWPHGEILAGIYSGRERKTVVLGTDTPVTNANNFELAAVRNRLPLQILTTAYEKDTNAALALVESGAYFLFKEGGEPEAVFFNATRDAVIRQVRESGRFMELGAPRKLPDGGVLHVFENLTRYRFLSKNSFVPASLQNIDNCNVTFDGKMQLSGLSMKRLGEGLQVRYRWRCLRAVERNYWCFTHVLDGAGRVVGYLDHPIVRGEPPTNLWEAEDVASEELVFRSVKLASGESHRLRLGLFDRVSGERMVISSSDFPLTDSGTAAVVKE